MVTYKTFRVFKIGTELRLKDCIVDKGLEQSFKSHWDIEISIDVPSTIPA
jgi:hypothetical protein